MAFFLVVFADGCENEVLWIKLRKLKKDLPILTQLESMWYHTIGIVAFCSGAIKAYRNKAERY